MKELSLKSLVIKDADNVTLHISDHKLRYTWLGKSKKKTLRERNHFQVVFVLDASRQNEIRIELGKPKAVVSEKRYSKKNLRIQRRKCKHQWTYKGITPNIYHLKFHSPGVCADKRLYSFFFY